MKKLVRFLCTALLAICLSSGLAAQAAACQAVVGSGEPTGLTLDNNSNVWAAFFSGNYILQIQSSNCAILKKVFVESGPNGIAFDGANIWVSNFNSNTISKVNASTGALLGSFGVGSGPRGVVFDGTFIWVANYNSNTVSKIQPSNGALLGNFAVGSGPFFMAVDTANTTIWVANRNSNNVMALNQSGVIQITTATHTQPQFLAFDGTNMWASCYNSQRVDEISPSGVLLKSISVSGHNEPIGIAFDSFDETIRGVTHGGYLFSVNTSTNAVTFTFFGGVSNSGYDVKFDPVFRLLWVADFGGGLVEGLAP